MSPRVVHSRRRRSCFTLGAVISVVVGSHSASAEVRDDAAALAGQSSMVSDRGEAPGERVLSADDHAFLDDLQKRGIQYFLDEADPETGLMPDRARAIGGHTNEIASIASVGFGLTSLCIGEERGWVPKQEVYDRAFRVLRFLRDKAPQERGHFYHFLNMRTGAREWNCEVSNIDTAILMAGILTVRQHFPGTDLAALCTELYDRVEWPWLMTDSGSLCMGWTPESGFINAKWDHYSEGAPLILLLALGSNTHPLPPEAWQKWKRDPFTYAGMTYLQCGPLFTHQYPQCWFDLRGLRDDHMDFYRNSQLATIAQRKWMMDELSKDFPDYGPNFWGLTASDFEGGYTAWGGPPSGDPNIDGSVVPAAAAGSLAFEPKICIDTLRFMKEKYGDKAYVKYGFVDAFRPARKSKPEWYNQDVIGIDVGPSVIMAENARTGFVWKTFMSSPEAQRAIKLAGFRGLAPAEKSQANSSIHRN